MISVITMKNRTTLDIDAVRAFILIADFKSFTRAAQAVGVTQSAISLQLKRLEARLASRLIERTPRSVELTNEGTVFLDRARNLVAAHDHAVAGALVAPRRLTLGISDHVAGPELPTVLARVSAFDPGLNLDVRIGLSNELLDEFENAKFDAVIVRRESHRRGGEKLLEDEFGWFAAPVFRPRPGEKLRLAMLAAPCGVRALAIHTLDKAKVAWVEAFTGGGVSAIARGDRRRSCSGAIGASHRSARHRRCWPSLVTASTWQIINSVAFAHFRRSGPWRASYSGGGLPG